MNFHIANSRDSHPTAMRYKVIGGPGAA